MNVDFQGDLDAAVAALKAWDGAAVERGSEAVAKLERIAARATRELNRYAPDAGGEHAGQWSELLRLAAGATATFMDLSVWADPQDEPEAERARLSAFRSQLATAALFRLTANGLSEVPGGWIPPVAG